jgi:hypothetical protein
MPFGAMILWARGVRPRRLRQSGETFRRGEPYGMLLGANPPRLRQGCKGNGSRPQVDLITMAVMSSNCGAWLAKARTASYKA